MNKTAPCIVLFILLATALLLFITSTMSTSTVPSPFLIAATIVSAVALFGAMFSLYIKKEQKIKYNKLVCAEKPSYSLHCFKLRNSSSVWFRMVLSTATCLTAEPGKQTITFPRKGCLNPNAVAASSVKVTNRLVICQVLGSKSALCTSPNSKLSEVNAFFQNSLVISTIKKPLLEE